MKNKHLTLQERQSIRLPISSLSSGKYFTGKPPVHCLDSDCPILCLCVFSIQQSRVQFLPPPCPVLAYHFKALLFLRAKSGAGGCGTAWEGGGRSIKG